MAKKKIAKRLTDVVIEAPIHTIINAGYLNRNGTISVLITGGRTHFDLEFKPKDAQTIVDGLTAALKRVAKARKK